MSYQGGTVAGQGQGHPASNRDTYQQFYEPTRYLNNPEQHIGDTYGLPPSLLAFFYRVRNTFAVYNFFLFYCLNALLNVEIYREYMDSHAANAVNNRTHTWYENLYIATLAAPLVDVLARCVARNFLKLNLAKAQSHVSFPPSLAITTPSLNAYALLILRRNKGTIFVVMTLDVLEICYSFYMWHLQPVKTEALVLKLIFLIVSSIFFLTDVFSLIQMRRFFKRLPRHMNPIFICWDVNNSFHWHSPNSVFDIMEKHEDLSSATFTSADSKRVRTRIAQWNEGEADLATLELPGSPQSAEEDDEERSDSQSEHGSLLNSRR